MAKKIFTLQEFRENLEKMIQGDRINSSRDNDNSYLDTLDKLGQLSDEELLDAKLYADLGLDSIDLWELVCMLECDYNISISDEIDYDFGTGVNLTVAKCLQAVNEYQVEI